MQTNYIYRIISRPTVISSLVRVPPCEMLIHYSYGHSKILTVL